MKIALLQMTSGIDPACNLRVIEDAITETADRGAAICFTPEMSGLLDRDRARSGERLFRPEDDPVLAGTCAAAARAGVWVALGSLALRRDEARLANRSFVIDDHGVVRASYDKLHLFDVDLGDGEQWRESAVYAPGEGVVVAQTPIGKLGLSICYDLRFPALYAALGAAGAELLAVPSAFTRPTGAAHWEVLLRARAIESGAFVIAAAQTGEHADGRATWGHSMVVDPWGEVLLDMGEAPGLSLCEIDLDRVRETRARVPALSHRRIIPDVEVTT